MNKLLIAVITLGLLATAPVTLADWSGDREAGAKKVHDRDSSPLRMKIIRAQGHHHKHDYHRGHYREKGKWNKHRGQKRHHHGSGRRDHRHGQWHNPQRHDHGYRGKRHERRHTGSFFGASKGDRGVLIWRR